MNLTKEQRKQMLKDTIKAVESSANIPEALEKLGLKSRQALHKRLQSHGYVIIRFPRLKVVKR